MTGFTRHLIALCCMTLLWAAPVTAQDDDGTFLSNLIEKNLSGAGRDVQIRGFTGALSSRATMDEMTIADDDGIWLRLEDVVLDWNRSALLRGRLEVEELSAQIMELPRLPKGEQSSVPDAEASGGFSLPELPVSVDVETFLVEKLLLGAPLLGEAAELNLSATASLADGSAAATIKADRVDGARGTFLIEASYDNETGNLALDISLSEEQEGLIARLIDLPGLPSVAVTVQGEGPLDDYTADLELRTDDTPRLAGTIGLAAEEASGAEGTPRRFTADLGGDVTALFAPQYRDFFGEDVRLIAAGRRAADGALDLDAFSLTANALSLEGSVALNRDNWPTRLDITGAITPPEGTAVTLPLGGLPTQVAGVTLDIDFDSSDGNAWTGKFDVTGLERSDFSARELVLDATGTLTGEVNAIGAVTADVTFDAAGLAPENIDLATAIGDTVAGKLSIAYAEEQPLRLTGLDISGTDYGLTGDATLTMDSEAGFPTQLDARLDAQDLARFAGLSGQKLTGAAAMDLNGTAALIGGVFDLDLNGQTTDLALGIAQADAVLAGQTDLFVSVKRDETGTVLDKADIRNDQIALTGRATLGAEESDATFNMVLEDASLLEPSLNGPVKLTGSATQRAEVWSVDVDGSGPAGVSISVQGAVTGPDVSVEFDAQLPDIKPFVPDYSGAARVYGTATQNTAGAWSVDVDAQGPYGLTAMVDGTLTGPDVSVSFDARLPDIKPFVPDYSGAARVYGTATQNAQAQWALDVDTEGPYGLAATVEGRVTGPDRVIAFTAALPDIQPLVPAYTGALKLAGTATEGARGWSVKANADGPYGLDAMVDGRVTGPERQVAFQADLPNVRPFAPGISGPLSVGGTASEGANGGWSVDTNATGPLNSTASVQGLVTGPEAAVSYQLDVPNIAPLVRQLNGPLSLDGTAEKAGLAWRIDTGVAGPAGTTAQVAGFVRDGGTLDMAVSGRAPLGLAGPFIAPRSITGTAEFDLDIQGPPALEAVAGRINISNTRVFDPNFRLALENIRAAIDLNRGRANMDLTANVSSGGILTVNGPVTLTGAMPANLTIALQQIRLVDPTLYETGIDGTLRVNGPLQGGARIAGDITIGETEISVPSSGITAFGEIPDIRHVGDSAAVRATRSRARLDAPTGNGAAASGGPGFGLDITVSAPARIFVRGRGLDAELGGQVRLTGSTNNVITAGRFELIRGRLDILEQRFDLDEGAVLLQGGLEPAIRLVAQTQTNTGTASIIVSGPISQPEVTFASTPEAPQDEVLAQLIFGRDVSQLSPLQALQLANAVAVLAGRGGESVISKLRKGLSLDDLDIVTDEDGGTAVRAGKYISENIYTDITVGNSNNSEISLNLDITSDITAKGSVGSDGNTSLGVFFERDY